MIAMTGSQPLHAVRQSTLDDVDDSIFTGACAHGDVLSDFAETYDYDGVTRLGLYPVPETKPIDQVTIHMHLREPAAQVDFEGILTEAADQLSLKDRKLEPVSVHPSREDGAAEFVCRRMRGHAKGKSVLVTAFAWGAEA